MFNLSSMYIKRSFKWTILFLLQKKANGAPNGFYGEIDWDRYVSTHRVCLACLSTSSFVGVFPNRPTLCSSGMKYFQCLCCASQAFKCCLNRFMAKRFGAQPGSWTSRARHPWNQTSINKHSSLFLLPCSFMQASPDVDDEGFSQRPGEGDGDILWARWGNSPLRTCRSQGHWLVCWIDSSAECLLALNETNW